MTADDDSDLWQKMANTVKRKPSSRAHPQDADLAPRPFKQKQPRSASAKKKQITVPSSAKLKPKSAIQPADLRLGQRAGIDRSSTKRLTQGRYEIDDTLDLHGMTQAAAHAKLRQFIVQAANRGDRTVLVITGKGAAGQGVLRQQVPIWLKEQDLSPYVIAIAQASGKDGGGGALYIRLRRNREQTI